MSVTIKRAELSDVSIVAYLFNQYRQWYHQQADLEGAVNFLRERLTNSDSTILLALVENEPAGFTQLYSIFSSVRMKKALLLNDLFVAKNARKKGVAAELLKAAAEFGKKYGATYLMLQTGHNNLQAQALYEKTGWKMVKDYIYEFDLE